MIRWIHWHLSGLLFSPFSQLLYPIVELHLSFSCHYRYPTLKNSSDTCSTLLHVPVKRERGGVILKQNHNQNNKLSAMSLSLSVSLCLSLSLSLCLSLSLFLFSFLLRLWQEQGYLLIYITGRPIFQKEYITSWLTLQGFPLGIVSFSDTLSTDAQNTKLLYLARLMKEVRDKGEREGGREGGRKGGRGREREREREREGGRERRGERKRNIKEHNLHVHVHDVICQLCPYTNVANDRMLIRIFHVLIKGEIKCLFL